MHSLALIANVVHTIVTMKSRRVSLIDLHSQCITFSHACYEVPCVFSAAWADQLSCSIHSIFHSLVLRPECLSLRWVKSSTQISYLNTYSTAIFPQSIAYSYCFFLVADYEAENLIIYPTLAIVKFVGAETCHNIKRVVSHKHVISKL